MPRILRVAFLRIGHFPAANAFMLDHSRFGPIPGNGVGEVCITGMFASAFKAAESGLPFATIAIEAHAPTKRGSQDEERDSCNSHDSAYDTCRGRRYLGIGGCVR